MFERFSHDARLTMAYANQEAQRLNHDYIGTEHILLGILRVDDSIAATALRNFGVLLSDARRALEHIIKTGPDTLTAGKLPQTPIAKHVIEQAIAESTALNTSYVGPEHMLLAMLQMPECPAAQVLLNIGLALDEVRSRVLQMIRATPAEPSAKPPPYEQPQESPTEPPDAPATHQHADTDESIRLRNPRSAGRPTRPAATQSMNHAISIMWDETTPGIPATSANLLLAFLDVPESLVARILERHGITRKMIDNLAIQLATESPEP